MNPPSPWLRRDMARIFIGLWLVYGLLIDEHDLRHYTLSPAVIEAFVERGTFDVTGSESFVTPDDPRSTIAGKHVIGDYFVHGRRILAAKQPGLFVLDAVPYFFLYELGITFRDHYLLASALVSWLSGRPAESRLNLRWRQPDARAGCA